MESAQVADVVLRFDADERSLLVVGTTEAALRRLYF